MADNQLDPRALPLRPVEDECTPVLLHWRKEKAALQLAIPWKVAIARCLCKRFLIWRRSRWDPSTTGFDIVKIQTPPGDPKAQSLSSSAFELTQHVGEGGKKERRKGEVHQRLYAEAKRKRVMLAQYEEARRTGDMKECTFTPKPRPGHSISSPTVHERLYQSLKSDKAKEQVNLKKRHDQEMVGCTFSPRVRAFTATRLSSFTRLCSDAENRQNEGKARSGERYNRRDESSRENAESGSVKISSAASPLKAESLIHDRLFSESLTLATKLRKQQLEQTEKETESTPFSPRINPRKSEIDSAPVYQRLYGLSEAHMRKLEKKREEQSFGSGKAGRKESEEAGARFEKLYQNGLEKQHRQAELMAKVDSELGINFTPKTNLHPAKHSPHT